MRVFVSYSRHEIAFADSLSRALEKRGHEVWIDFRGLAPGRAWDRQIASALEKATAVLVVVSRESVASEHVSKEWRMALEQGKRLILLVFEAQPLPPELARLEWVDFRQPFKRAVNQLNALLISAPTSPLPAPHSGTRLPPIPRLFFILSIFMAVGSVLFALPTLILPWYLVRLPRQIRRREYHSGTLTRFLVFSLPANIVGWFVTSSLLMSSNLEFFVANVGIQLLLFAANLTFIVALLINALLMIALLWLTRGMYRWAGPGGIARTRRPRKIKRPDSFVPMAVALDYDNRDGRIVKELAGHLEKAGHTVSENPQSADLTLVLLSRYKSGTDIYPEAIRLLPVLLQTTEVDPALSVLQWIDLRRGVKRFAQASLLLGRPGQITQALGVLPAPSLQQVRPVNVSALINFFWTVLIIKGIGSIGLLILLLSISVPFDYSLPVIAVYLLLSAVGVATTLAARRSLNDRQGVFKSALGLALALFITAYFAFPGVGYLAMYSNETLAASDQTPGSRMLAMGIFMCGGVLWAELIGVFMLASKDVRLWMARPDQPM